MNSMFEVPVKSDEAIIVYTPDYLKKMSELVIKTDRRFVSALVWPTDLIITVKCKVCLASSITVFRADAVARQNKLIYQIFGE